MGHIVRIIKFPNMPTAKQIAQDWHKMLKPKFKAIGRKFKKDGEIFNRHKGQDVKSSTIIEFYFDDELNGHHLVHPEVWITWPAEWIDEMIEVIPDELTIIEKELPPEEE
jgi:hypothetical protein